MKRTQCNEKFIRCARSNGNTKGKSDKVENFTKSVSTQRCFTSHDFMQLYRFTLSMCVLMTVKFTWEMIINKSISQRIVFSSRTSSIAKFRRGKIQFQMLRYCCQIHEWFKKYKMLGAVALNTNWRGDEKRPEKARDEMKENWVFLRWNIDKVVEEEWSNRTDFWTSLMLNNSCCFNNCALCVFRLFKNWYFHAQLASDNDWNLNLWLHGS